MNATNILLPVDGSEYSDKAADMAADIAKQNGASIVLLHVRKPVPSGLGRPNADELLDHLTQGAEAVMDIYRKKLNDAGVTFTDLVIGGKVGEVVADVVRVEKCDLVVIGSKGKTDFEGLLVGSVTHMVLHTVNCPVLVVK